MRPMKLAPVVVAVLFAVGTVSDLTARGAAQSAAAWTTLFDGSNLNNWNPIGNANWRLADGGVEASSGTGFLVSKASYADFELRVEVWVDPAANSGVFIRCSNPSEITAMNAYEVNIFDMRPDPAYRTGAIVNVAKPMSMVNAGNRWNTLEIGAKGPRLTVRLNDTPMVDVQDMTHARGPIALQYGAGIVKFRNVQIR
jgi:hypothetical protein